MSTSLTITNRTVRASSCHERPSRRRSPASVAVKLPAAPPLFGWSRIALTKFREQTDDPPSPRRRQTRAHAGFGESARGIGAAWISGGQGRQSWQGQPFVHGQRPQRNVLGRVGAEDRRAQNAAALGRHHLDDAVRLTFDERPFSCRKRKTPQAGMRLAFPHGLLAETYRDQWRVGRGHPRQGTGGHPWPAAKDNP